MCTTFIPERKAFFNPVYEKCGLEASVYAQSTQLFDWPRWRGANGDGVSLETAWNPQALQGNIKTLWKASVGEGFSSVVIQNNFIYTIGIIKSDNIVVCLDANTGEVIWKTSLGGWAPPQSTPTIDGDRLYCVTQSKVFCLNKSNGAIIWNRADVTQGVPPRRGSAASPVVAGTLLFINGNSEGVGCDKMTGNLIWRTLDDLPLESWGSIATPIASNILSVMGTLFLGPSSLYAMNPTTGKRLWSYPNKGALYEGADPVVSGDSVFISLPETCALLQVSGTEPKLIWGNSELTTWLSTPVLVDGYLYGSHLPPEFSGKTLVAVKRVKKDISFAITTAAFRDTLDGMKATDFPFRCIDWNTGKVLWEKQMKYVFIMAAGGKLIMQELNGTFHVADATSKSYKELASSDALANGEEPQLFAAPPVLCNGKLYCRSYAGALICIDVR